MLTPAANADTVSWFNRPLWARCVATKEDEHAVSVLMQGPAPLDTRQMLMIRAWCAPVVSVIVGQRALELQPNLPGQNCMTRGRP